MIKRLLCLLFVLTIALSMSPVIAEASGNLDEIETYKITVDMESDGTMDLTYHIDWKVLDDSSEGPLSWIQVGIPNQHVNNIKALSSNISDISYYSDGGDYVRIDLDRNYYADEIIPLDFSIHQSYMYRLDRENNSCSYEFTPGWYDETDVKSLIILWKNENVLNSDSNSTEGNYLKWTASLSAGERFSVTVNYRTGVFSTTDDQSADYTDDYSGDYTSDYGQDTEGEVYTSYDYNDDANAGIGIFFVVIFIIVIVVISILKGGGGYRGGFGTGGRYIGGSGGGIGGGGHCACASSCACACACACAGGGRAGCSAKNLYGAIQTDSLQRVLQRNSMR
jgi:hypothetical protein